MRFMWLKDLAHNQALLEEIRQTGHDKRIEHINLEVKSVPDMKPIEWHAFHKSDARDESGVLPGSVSTVADTQGPVDGCMHPMFVFADCLFTIRKRSRHSSERISTCSLVQRSPILDIQVWEGAVYVSAYFLARFRRAKDPNDGHLRLLCGLGGAHIVAKAGIISGGLGLVMIDAVQADLEHIHADRSQGLDGAVWVARGDSADWGLKKKQVLILIGKPAGSRKLAQTAGALSQSDASPDS